MRFNVIQAIYRKEMLDLLRDRRTLISMLVVPSGRVSTDHAKWRCALTSRIEERSEIEAKTLASPRTCRLRRCATPSTRSGSRSSIDDDLHGSLASKKKRLPLRSRRSPERPPQMHIYVDGSNPTSSAAGDKIRDCSRGAEESGKSAVACATRAFRKAFLRPSRSNAPTLRAREKWQALSGAPCCGIFFCY